MSAKRHVGSETGLSRRQWLSGVTGVVVTGMLAEREGAAQQPNASRPYRIDTHHHHSQGGAWTPERSIEVMDRGGIATAVLSRPGIPVSEPEKARKLARDANEYGTRLVRDYPGRFGLFATLPLFDVEGSLREIAYGFDVLKAHGVCFSSSYGKNWPGDPSFAPVFDELNRRKAVVFVHPAVPAYYTDDLRLEARAAAGESGLQPAALEFMFDATRAIVSLILNGTLFRCPDIRFIFSHGGGTLPFLHERLDHLIGEDPPAGTASDGRYRSKYVPNGFVNEMKKLYFDVVRVANPATFSLLTKLMPPERLLFGTDYPFVPPSETVGHLPGLNLEGQLLQGLERDNALALFPSFKA